MDNFSKLFTKDNITFVLALLGSLGTLVNWLFHILKGRKKITFVIDSYYLCETFLQVHFTIINNSALSLVVSGISFKYDRKYYPCSTIPNVIQEETLMSHPNENRKLSTIPFPINLCPYTGISGFLSFAFHSETDIDVSTPATFVISSNRGKALESECMFPDKMSEAF